MAHPLSNIEIDNSLKHLEHYRRCYMVDALPKKILENEISVVNFDKSINPGTHWVLLYNSSDDDYVLYIDPFGIVPPLPILKYLRSSKKKIMYNTTQIQDLNSVMCGYYCIYFAIELSKKKDLHTVLYHFSTNTKINEILIKKYFNLK